MGFRKNTELALSGKANTDRQFVKSLARGLEVLQAFQPDDRGLSNAELARRTRFPKATVSRLTFTLLALGFLRLDEETGRYLLHPHVLSLGYPVLRQLSIREVARPLMQDLAELTRSAVALGVRDGANMIIVERSRHPSMMVVPIDIGVGREIATTAMGRAYLAALTERERAGVLKELKSRNERRWPVLKRTIDEAISAYLRLGYTVSAGEWMSEYNAVGVPLRLVDGTVLAFNCGGASMRISAKQLPELGERLADMVGKLERLQEVAP